MNRNPTKPPSSTALVAGIALILFGMPFLALETQASVFAPATDVAADWHTCILTSTGNVDCYGYNSHGQAEDYLGGDAIATSVGESHTCVLKATGNVDCYGSSNSGQNADYLGGDAVALEAGQGHNCVLKATGNVDCWGANFFGQTADYSGGDATAVSAGAGGYYTCVLKVTGNVDCYGSNSDGQAEDYSGGDATAVSAGGQHTCVLKATGNVDCYGDNSYSQNADYTGGDATAVIAGGWHTCVLTATGNVDCWGNNYSGQAVDYSGGDATAVSAGRDHTCVLKTTGTVDCWGDNDYGQAEDYPPSDIDGDSVPDSADNCPSTPNPGQADADSDGIGDACDGQTERILLHEQNLGLGPQPGQPVPDHEGVGPTPTPPVEQPVGVVSTRDVGTNYCVFLTPEGGSELELACIGKAFLGPLEPSMPRGDTALLFVESQMIPGTGPIVTPDVPPTPGVTMDVDVSYYYDAARLTPFVSVLGHQTWSPVAPTPTDVQWLADPANPAALTVMVTVYRDGVSQGTVGHAVPALGQVLAAAEKTAGNLP